MKNDTACEMPQTLEFNKKYFDFYRQYLDRGNLNICEININESIRLALDQSSPLPIRALSGLNFLCALVFCIGQNKSSPPSILVPELILTSANHLYLLSLLQKSPSLITHSTHTNSDPKKLRNRRNKFPSENIIADFIINLSKTSHHGQLLSASEFAYIFDIAKIRMKSVCPYIDVRLRSSIDGPMKATKRRLPTQLDIKQSLELFLENNPDEFEYDDGFLNSFLDSSMKYYRPVFPFIYSINYFNEFEVDDIDFSKKNLIEELFKFVNKKDFGVHCAAAHYAHARELISAHWEIPQFEMPTDIEEVELIIEPLPKELIDYIF